jgi:serine/threonine protein kinase
MALQPGDKLGPYEIIAPIGKGGMGEVWKARDPRVGRDVALSLRSGGTDFMLIFQLENAKGRPNQHPCSSMC